MIAATHNGVLLPRWSDAPESMALTTEAQRDAYAAETKRVNGLFVAAFFAMEDRYGPLDEFAEPMS